MTKTEIRDSLVKQLELRGMNAEFDMRTNSLIDSKYYYIYPNDVIYVARERNSLYTVNNYSSFVSLITSSVALLTTVLNYVAVIYK